MAVSKLSQLDDWEVADDDQDIRGAQLRDHDRRPIGTIEDMLVDTDEEYVTTLILDNGEQVDADDVDIKDDGVFLRGERSFGKGHDVGGGRAKVRIYDRDAPGSARPTL